MKRGAYREDCRQQLDALEAKRVAAGVTMDEWAARAGVSRRNLRYIMKDGRAFRRTLNALTFAMRELAKERQRAGQMFAGAAS